MRLHGWIFGGVLCLAACGNVTTGPVISDGAESVIPDAARAIEDRWQAGVPASFVAEVQLTDAKGNPSTEPALQFEWSSAALSGINAEHITQYQLVDLADVTILSARGVIAFVEWCDLKGGVLTPRLCRQERARAEEAWALKASA